MMMLPAADFGKIQLNQTWQESEIGDGARFPDRRS
jgi:hypothetical protein